MIEKVCESSKFKDKSYSYLQPGSCVPRLSTQATVWGKSTENPLRMKDRLKPDSEEYMRAIKNTSTYTAEGRWCKPVAGRAAAATWPTSCERALVELGESSVGALQLGNLATWQLGRPAVRRLSSNSVRAVWEPCTS